MARQISAFVPLRCRTPYSILEGAIQIKDLAKRCREWRMPAAGITDTDNMCGVLEYSTILSEAGIQPIIGCTLHIDCEREREINRAGPQPVYDGTLVLFAQNELGYKNLMALSSDGYLKAGATELPHIKLSDLKGRSDGLIALSGGHDGALNQLLVLEQTKAAGEYLQTLQSLFPDRFYIEIQRHGLDDERKVEPALVDYAYARNLPLVATNEPYFLDPNMYEAHDSLLAIAEGSYVLETDRRRLSKEHYFKSPEEMLELFADLPEAIHNTREIAKRCAFRSPKRKAILPNFGKDGHSEADILAATARTALETRLSEVELAAPQSAYEERLQYELKIINQMGFPGYFLIVADFIQWAKAQGIPVGPGRGSGAGSVVAWALTITDLDPLRYGLLFERFLNPERVSMPDFDVDFCQERRGEVIHYVQEKYGKSQVAHIITFGTLQARAVVRDVGRVLQMPLGQVDRLAKLVPSNPANPVSLAEAIRIEPALKRARDEEKSVAELLTIALQLEGLYRNASTHAAGVVIGDRPLTELVPLYLDPRSDIPATQFTMKWVEKAGLVKFDFLGLKTLTVIDRTLKFLKKQGREIDIAKIPHDDEKAYKLLENGFSQGVFQLESSGMRDVLRKIAPDSIEELTAIISLYRPGPMKNIDDYINRKFGRTKITYPHPSLEDILKETYGIIIYQEQVMQIAQVLSGYSLGEADVLRRAMGKKDKEEMARQKSRFIDGAEKNGVKSALASDIFELVNEFAGYGFNKSHAAAYAMISYQTAYLKAHYPAEFMAASMSLDINNVEKLAVFHQEAKRMGLEFVPPCVLRSKADFDVEDGKILYALAALKNVGLEAMNHLVEERETNGAFKDIFDFARRVDSRIVNKRAYENMARAGAFDQLLPNRACVLKAAPTLLSIGARASEERNSTQVSLFGDENIAMAEPNLPEIAPWPLIEKLSQELGAVGFYLSGHPLDTYFGATGPKAFVLSSKARGAYMRGSRVVRMAGVLHKKQERTSQRTGKRFAYLMLSDPSGDFEVFMGEELLNAYRDICVAGELLDLQVKLEMRDGELGFTASMLRPFTGGRVEERKKFRFYIRNEKALPSIKTCLENVSANTKSTKSQIKVILPVSPEQELHIKIPGLFALNADSLAAIKAIADVEKIDEVHI